jgi:hypothetical protein
MLYLVVVDFLIDDVVWSAPHSRRTHHDIPLDQMDLLTAEQPTEESAMSTAVR